jgi:hypothetical protein
MPQNSSTRTTQTWTMMMRASRCRTTRVILAPRRTMMTIIRRFSSRPKGLHCNTRTEMQLAF